MQGWKKRGVGVCGLLFVPLARNLKKGSSSGTKEPFLISWFLQKGILLYPQSRKIPNLESVTLLPKSSLEIMYYRAKKR